MKKIKVFADLHQDDLYYSLHLLFERRLGWELYRPIGLDWHKKGFWAYNHNPEVVKQYLRINDFDKNLGDYYECPESKHNYNHRALTFDQFLDTDIDIIIASVTAHEMTYWNLIRQHKPKAKLIRQIGNIHETVNIDVCKNLMASANISFVPENCNIVTYHQEFDLKTFDFQPRSVHNRITNLMNCYPDSKDFKLWAEYKKELPEFDWKMYGILGEDGIIGSDKEVAKACHHTTFLWHLKFGGDGFGHVIHNAFATGRPPIVKGSYYKDKMAGHLMEDGVTCIDLEKGSFQQNVNKIRFWSQPENLKKMSEAAYESFQKNVDFDKEFVYLKKFLNNLV